MNTTAHITGSNLTTAQRAALATTYAGIPEIGVREGTTTTAIVNARTISALVDRGYLESDGAARRYRLTVSGWSMARVVILDRVTTGSYKVPARRKLTDAQHEALVLLTAHGSRAHGREGDRAHDALVRKGLASRSESVNAAGETTVTYRIGGGQ